MIVSFRVGNFLSFASEQSLSFRASSDQSHRESHCVRTPFPALPRLTRTALIIGANASGKSNLLLALRTMRELVLHSTEFTQLNLRNISSPLGLPATRLCQRLSISNCCCTTSATHTASPIRANASSKNHCVFLGIKSPNDGFNGTGRIGVHLKIGSLSRRN